MLLNTDWYVNSMARKAYESDAIPISMEQNQYRQGTRDFIQFGQVKGIDQKKFYDIANVVDFVTQDKHRQQTQQGRKINVVPTRKLKIPVDSAKVVANGTVLPEDADKIVDAITFTSSNKNRQGQETKNYILKNELVLWDILAHFNWDRPIYFSITMGTDSFYGLQKYFRQEGFAYRLVPIRTNAPQTSMRHFGSADVEGMYDKLMNRFEWGGYEDTTLWMDENNLRFVTNIRFTFGRLANELIAQGDNERAEAVLDRVVEVAVNSNTPMNATVSRIIDGFYKIGANEKGNDLARRLMEREGEFLNYYFDQDDNRYAVVAPNARNSISMLGQLANMTANMYPGSGLGDEMSQTYQEYVTIFQSN
jgi:hypothetical protein